MSTYTQKNFFYTKLSMTFFLQVQETCFILPKFKYRKLNIFTGKSKRSLKTRQSITFQYVKK